ncbi:MAG: sigma-54 dependent transcriptional regulator [Polyangiales bacterium]
MRALDRTLRAVAPKDVTLTIVGESGTGKEVVARRAHSLSSRAKGPFVPINCAAIPEALLESELFGHEKGAFTGASGLARGKIEAAHGGTLFLDEIGEMPLPSQAKLLRFLENRRFMRVGGNRKIEADVRLVVATLRPLESEVRAGRFRNDLYHRIQGITLRVPPLRERRADIGPLLEHFLAAFVRRHGVERPRLTREAKRLLLAHDWPGNVRELRNVAEMLCLLRSGRPVRAKDLPSVFVAGASGRPDAAAEAPNATITLDLDTGLAAMTEAILSRALELEDGSAVRAAARLRISPRTMQRFVQRGRSR